MANRWLLDISEIEPWIRPAHIRLILKNSDPPTYHKTHWFESEALFLFQLIIYAFLISWNSTLMKWLRSNLPHCILFKFSLIHMSKLRPHPLCAVALLLNKIVKLNYCNLKLIDFMLHKVQNPGLHSFCFMGLVFSNLARSKPIASQQIQV